uniref:FLYWCH-type domain-containing protein n=1 Tax=Caenorhabditis japonica TaxID=281687 RepID=A0A8R1HPJ6_CAEJA
MQSNEDSTNAFSALNQFTLSQNLASASPTKALANPDFLNLLRGLQNSGQLPPLQMPMLTQIEENPPFPSDLMLKASPSAGSDMSSAGDDEEQKTMPLQQLHIDSSGNISAGNPAELKSSRGENWIECFTTTRPQEYEALLYSVYVSERTDRKFDGWTYFDCLHRLQSKCRYKLRAKKQDEFFIVEERSVHNHGAVEPVGQAGSHAGLPKTVREIVDLSHKESWPVEMRAAKVDEEIKRLGLPANPRLGRQIDNRIAYLRRVNNLKESRQVLDQINSQQPGATIPTATNGLVDPQALQSFLEQNGGSLVVEKGVVEKLLGPQAAAALAVAQQEIQQEKSDNQKLISDLIDVKQSPELLQFLQDQQKLVHSQEELSGLLPAFAGGAMENFEQQQQGM